LFIVVDYRPKKELIDYKTSEQFIATIKHFEVMPFLFDVMATVAVR
jgi:hypothetical protein